MTAFNLKTHGICPVCDGTLRRPANDTSWKTIIAGYDSSTDTLGCDNCGGQTMYGRATGIVLLNKDGNPCTHEYTSDTIGRCLTQYSCKHCNYKYIIDSGG
jgi:hypothetical protein